jgi:hypothetical protein
LSWKKFTGFESQPEGDADCFLDLGYDPSRAPNFIRRTGNYMRRSMGSMGIMSKETWPFSTAPHPARSLHQCWLSPKKFFMDLVNIIIVLVVVGVILWLINRFIPMQGTIKSILNIVVIIVVILWLLKALGIWGGSGVDL